jgi:hypothetical protein
MRLYFDSIDGLIVDLLFQKNHRYVLRIRLDRSLQPRSIDSVIISCPRMNALYQDM